MGARDIKSWDLSSCIHPVRVTVSLIILMSSEGAKVSSRMVAVSGRGAPNVPRRNAGSYSYRDGGGGGGVGVVDVTGIGDDLDRISRVQ